MPNFVPNMVMWWPTCNCNTCTRGHRASFLILLMMGAWRSKHVEWLCRIKPAQRCIKLVFYLTYTTMHRNTKVKFSDAKQARYIHNYRNIKTKLYRTNAAIWYNKICRQKQLTPAHINIRIKGKNQQRQNTLRTAYLYRINQVVSSLIWWCDDLPATVTPVPGAAVPVF